MKSLRHKKNKTGKKFLSLTSLTIVILFNLGTTGCGCGCKGAAATSPLNRRTPLLVGEGRQFATLQEAVKSCHDGDTILVMEGVYRFDKAVELWAKNQVTIIGKGKVELICDNMTDNVMWITSCRDIKIKNIKARHTNPTKDERCYGNVFALDNSDNVTIENCDINGCGAIGVYILGGSGILLRGNHIHNNSLWAVQFNGTGYLREIPDLEGLHFENNIIENNRPRGTGNR